MLRLPMWCSAVPTHRKSSDLATAWKMSRKMAAQIAPSLPTPAQATMRPRLEMVEYASTRLALDWLMAASAQNRKVAMPTVITRKPGMLKPRQGEILMSRKTPALTIVDECSNADVGVGATMAPRSQLWKGICAALVNAASANRSKGA